MATPPQTLAPISILKAPPPLSSMALPSPSSSSSVNRHAALTAGMSEDEEDEGDLKYAVSDGDDDELAYVPSGKAQALLQSEKPCYSGCLLKKGEKRRTWKKRWFVLRTTKLAMYKDQKEYKLLRIIDLHDIHSLVQVTSKNKYQYVFAIITPKRMYYVQADDQHTMDGWFEAVDRAKQQLRSQHSGNMNEVDGANLTTKDVVTSYKSTSNMAQQHTRRRSSGATMTVDTQRQSGGIATPSIISASSSSSSSPHTTSLNVTFSHSPPTPKTTTLSTPMKAPLKINPPPPSSLDDYSVGQIYPLSPTNDQAQVHFSEDIAGSEDDEDYSASNSVMDVKKEESRNKVVIEGYLLKLGRNKGWQKRWFVLRTDTLAYYENEKEYSPHRIIPLDHITNTVKIDPISKNKRHCFKIIIPKRNYVLCANTKNEMDAWLDTLAKAPRQTKKDDNGIIKSRSGTATSDAQTQEHQHISPPSSSSSPISGYTHHHHPYHHTMRLAQITENEGQENGPNDLVRLPSDPVDNSSHISHVGGAGGALGHH